MLLRRVVYYIVIFVAKILTSVLRKQNSPHPDIEAAHSFETWCLSTKPNDIISRKTVNFMVTPAATSRFVGTGMKNEIPRKSFAFVLIRKDRGIEWHTVGSGQPKCTQISTGETDCP
jgi:hypothetical protein